MNNVDKIDFSKVAAETVNRLLELYRIGISDGRKQLQAELDKRHEKLVEALKKYGDHEPCCVKGNGCNCGFEQALKEAKEETGMEKERGIVI